MAFLLGMTIIKEALVTSMKSLLKVGAGDSLFRILNKILALL
jgi:hypothetical protein